MILRGGASRFWSTRIKEFDFGVTAPERDIHEMDDIQNIGHTVAVDVGAFIRAVGTRVGIGRYRPKGCADSGNNIQDIGCAIAFRVSMTGTETLGRRRDTVSRFIAVDAVRIGE